MSLTAPYTNAMRIGQGFNTYTQEIRLENAVLIGPTKKVSKSKSKTGNEAYLSPPVTPEISAAAGPIGDIAAVAINGVTASSAELLGRSMRPPSPSPSPDMGGALDVITSPAGELPFEIPAGPIPTTSQSVTYSTRAIDNVSDIMDALNISTSMSIKYGTIHGNGNASFVNETKVLDSELNYVVSVIVNNDAQAAIEAMEFQDIAGLPLDRFTEVYGDSFISGFTEGGEFNAVISIKLTDKTKHKAVKQAVDMQLAVGPPTLELGAQESTEKQHNEALRNSEISISVNWAGGGEIKKPHVAWTIPSVVAVANAFPSMVARSSARTQAILLRYTSLRSFQAWKWSRLLEERRLWESEARNQKGGEDNRDGSQRYEEPVIILNYVPCSLYTADLFDALMNYKKLWKRIGEMLQNPSHYKLRPSPPKKAIKAAHNKPSSHSLSPVLTKGLSKPSLPSSPSSPCQDQAVQTIGIERAFTFNVEEGALGWNLLENNAMRDSIPPEPVALSEARLLCREAMTLITEEASRLVDHPHLAYAEYDALTKSTRMKRPNYAYPEVLAQRLPVPIYNAIVSDLSTDGAYLKTMAFANPAHDNLWFEPDMVGDAKASVADVASRFGGKYEDFSTLDLTEARGGGGGAADRGLGGGAGANPLRRLTLHRYRLNPLISLMARPALRRAVNGIGAIGLALLYEDPTASSVRSDGCTHHLGDTHHRDLHDSTTYTALDLRGSVDIAKLDVAYVPGTGYIAGVTFFDRVGRGEGGGVLTERLRWRQWEGKEPEGVVHVDNEPPERGDGAVWLFVGLAGTWVNTFGHGHLLARVSGVWRREGEEDG